jgi:hypothetical protein
MPIVSHLHHLFKPRNVSIVYPYVALERSPAPMSPLSAPQRQSLGHVPLPGWTETLPL